MRWSAQELDLLKKWYGKVKIDEFQRLYTPNRSIQAIQKVAQRQGIKGNYSTAQRIYQADEHYFDKPTIENCYWAGFIAADGGLGKDGVVTITLAEKDQSVLQAFKVAADIQHPIIRYCDNGRYYVKLSVWGMYRWHQMLNKYWNITPNKSLTLQPPNLINTKHILSFIVGYFDGDGCWWVGKTSYNKDYVNWCVCGTWSMVTWIRQELKKRLLHIIWNDKPCLNGISKANYKIAYTCHKARAIRNLLLTIPLKFRLERKWAD